MNCWCTKNSKEISDKNYANLNGGTKYFQSLVIDIFEIFFFNIY